MSEQAYVELRDNATGQIVRHLDRYYYSYMWTDGNYSCDCNRHLFFCNALGIEPNPEISRECGSSKYTAIRAIFLDGTEERID